MARHRRYVRENESSTDVRNIRDGKKAKPKSTKPKSIFESWTNKVAIFVSFNIIVLILSIVYFCYQYYLENVVITPLDLPHVVTQSGLDVPDRYWGSYRPGVYFGLQTRSPATLMLGLMWFSQKIVNNAIEMRHWCEQWSSVKRSGWRLHDGMNFGIQEIEDEQVYVTASFVKQVGGKYGGDISAKIAVKPKPNYNSASPPISLMFYTLASGEAVLQPYVSDDSQLTAIHGQMESLGRFKISFHSQKPGNAILKYNYLRTLVHDGATHLKETILRNLALYKSEEQYEILGLVGHAASWPGPSGKRGNDFLVHQVSFIPPFEMEIVFESFSFSSRSQILNGSFYDNMLSTYAQAFQEKFEQTFDLKSKGYKEADIFIAESALSNMLGGIGYFFGSSLVQSVHNKNPVNYWHAPLYTAVPSRPFFPRGFLWDEGFHNLLLLHWNPDITKDIIGHWLDLMNSEGWIPREQILGVEARERVPREFVVQKNTNANPPTFFLPLDVLLQKMKNGVVPSDPKFFKRVLPRLKVWFQWFNRTQAGMFPGTYRWRGRDHQTLNELNPKTLTSGLDDYPRASHPTIEERHIDLRCWITFAARVLADIADYVGESPDGYRYTYNFLSDNRLLDKLHWSPSSQSYSDYGFHSTNVKLVKQTIPPPPGSLEPPTTQWIRVVYEQPDLRYIDNFGYVNLFPFLLQIITPDNPKLGKVLDDLKQPNLLWTKYGLRSLAKNSPYYMEYNTEHDPPYWRGPIWININYLALRALNYYAQVPGPYQQHSSQLYQSLRENVATNLLREYNRTGYLWEQYNDKTGHGQGSHSFTGWTALVVLIMGEIY